MEIKINETGEIKNLTIIDPKSGCDWVNDLMGNHDALPEYDDETGYYLMSQDDYDWWYALTTEYQAADDRYHALYIELDNDRAEELLDAAHNISVDLEDYPAALNVICDDFSD